MSDRCEKCGHPLTEGEWTSCDEKCRHGGVVRSLGGAKTNLDEAPFPAGDLPFIGFPVEACGRARVEERDCPECEGRCSVSRRVLGDPPQGHDEPCPDCHGSGRVRPLLCQTCEEMPER